MERFIIYYKIINTIKRLIDKKQGIFLGVVKTEKGKSYYLFEKNEQRLQHKIVYAPSIFSKRFN